MFATPSITAVAVAVLFDGIMSTADEGALATLVNVPDPLAVTFNII
jgi:hypothetical protein